MVPTLAGVGQPDFDMFWQVGRVVGVPAMGLSDRQWTILAASSLPV